MSHISQSSIFSPSVARQHLATTKDWNHIDAWLTAKYHPKAPPSIERTPETLKALLQLSSLNESADEERDLLHQSTLRAISILSDDHSEDDEDDKSTDEEDTTSNISTNASIQETLLHHLSPTGSTALTTLSTLHQILNPPNTTTSSLAHKILTLQTEDFALAQQESRISTMHHHLSTELSRINATIAELQSPTFQPSEELSKLTIDYTRKAKSLAAKLASTPQPGTQDANISRRGTSGGGGKEDTHPSLQEIIAEEKGFKQLSKEVRDLEIQVKSYHGLPQDTDLARLEVEGLRAELRELERRRDGLFEGLVERETPRGKR